MIEISVLILAFIGCLALLVNAVRLVNGGHYETGIANWIIGASGLFAVVLIGIPVTFDLFPTSPI